MLLHKVIGSIVGEITSLTQLVEYWHTMREDPGSNTIMDNVFFRNNSKATEPRVPLS
jgi:hypothetical protein